MISHVVLKSRSRSILESILWWLKMLEIFDHLLNYRILYTQQYCNCSTDKCCEAYGCMPSPDPGPLYFVCWPWELLWQRIVWCILFSTKHHTHASAMFSDTNNTYVVTPYDLRQDQGPLKSGWWIRQSETIWLTDLESNWKMHDQQIMWSADHVVNNK